MEDTSLHMHDLTVAAHQLINDWADTQVRGYLKEHPDLVEYRLVLLEKALQRVRAKVEAERAAGEWGGPLPAGDPEADFNGPAIDYAEHSCNCEWCLCCEPAGLGDDEPLIFTFPAA